MPDDAMGLRRVPYASVAALLRRDLVEREDAGTAALVRRLAAARRRRSFSRREFLAMCRWKSPRSVHHCERNSGGTIRRVSRAVFATRSERRRMELLTGLRGVSVPTASAILTLLDPRRYGVLDIRAWQLLFALGRIDRKAAGRGFTFRDWLEYLGELRRHARRLGVPARAVELTLFVCHQRLQKGRLYA